MPALKRTGEGFTFKGFDKSQRCYQVENTNRETGQVEVNLQGCTVAPVIISEILAKNWNSNKETILINGKQSTLCRIGINHELGGTDPVLSDLYSIH